MEIPFNLYCFLCIWTIEILTPAFGKDSSEKNSFWSRTGSDNPRYSYRKTHIGPVPFVNDIMTEWAAWGSWDKCSRTCGGGVRSRTRACITRYPRVMPGSGIRTSHDRCSGESVQYEVCGTDPCPAGQVSGISFRAAQCRHYNSKKVLGRVVNSWVPYTQGGINPCALVCEGEGEGIVYTFGKVTDGTYCKTDGGLQGLCVNGRCLRLSCDGRLGGVAQEDMCRVCGGLNDTCTRHRGVYHSERPSADQPFPGNSNDIKPLALKKAKSFGYHEVAKIPKGSTNVRVFENSSNFLALKSGEKYLLNGDWLIDWPGEIDAAGSTFFYQRKEDQSEELTSLGPTKSDLAVMALLREHNPGVFYEYWTPNYSKQSQANYNIVLVPLNTTVKPLSFQQSSLTTSAPSSTIPTSASSLPAEIQNLVTLSTTLKPNLKPAILTSTGLNKSLHKHSAANATNDSDIRRKSNKRVGHQRHQTPFDDQPSSASANKHLDKVSSVKKSKLKFPHRQTNSVYDYRYQDPLTKEHRSSKEDVEAKDKKKHSKHRNENLRKEEKKNRKNKKKKKKKQRPSYCETCTENKRVKQSFCTSDFVSRIEVLSEEEVGGHKRFEVLVLQSYKNKVPLLHKEFLWQDPCVCRPLHLGKSYIVMGMTEKGRGNEVRLILQRDSYVRKFSHKVLSNIMKVRSDEMKFCRRWRDNQVQSYFSQRSDFLKSLLTKRMAQTLDSESNFELN